MKKYTCLDIISDYPQHNYKWTSDVNDFWAQEKINRIGIPYSVLNSVSSINLFKTLHEIGHCQTFHFNQNISTREYKATQWAINHSNKYNVKLSCRQKKIWQDYIYSFATKKNKKKYQLNWDV